MTVVAWLACGAVVTTAASLSRPASAPGWPATAFAVGLCGGFLGGALVALIAGRHGALPALSVPGAAVGAVLLLDLAERASGVRSRPARDATIARAWPWVCRRDALLLAAVAGFTASVAANDALPGVVASLATVSLAYAQRGVETHRVRRWHR